jgi:hypothetical protein
VECPIRARALENDEGLTQAALKNRLNRYSTGKDVEVVTDQMSEEFDKREGLGKYAN